MAKPLVYNATLVEREDLTGLLAIFRVRPDEIPDTQGKPWFVPGQYMTIGLNRDGASADDAVPASVRRPMSIASAPQDRDVVEFYIRYVEHPESSLPLTHLLWHQHANDRMYMRPVAAGHFTLDHTIGTQDTRLKVMVAAGTGLAPFLSIARERLRKDANARLDDLAILHGVSYPEDLGYRSELERMVAEHGLKYIPTISRPQKAPQWQGATGRVESLFLPEKIEQTERALGLQPGALHPSRAVIYVCGLQGTIAQSLLQAIPRGFVPNVPKIRRVLEVDEGEPSTFYYEQYDNTPVLDVDDHELIDDLRKRLRAALQG